MRYQKSLKPELLPTTNSTLNQHEFTCFVKVIDAALKLRKLDHTNEIIQPLIAAVSNIKDALAMKGNK